MKTAIEKQLGGKRVVFTHGVQSFSLDYDDEDNMDFMKNMLDKCFDAFEKEIHNQAIKEAAESAWVECYGKEGDEGFRVCKESILKLLKK